MNIVGENRREFLSRASGGFGSLALAGILADNAAAADDPLSAKPGHHPPTADRVIFLYSTGGVSQVDTFNHRPQLTADHGKSITASRWLNQTGEFERYLIKPRYGFQQYGQSGTWVSELFPHIGSVIDDVCVLNAMYCESDGHDKATLAAHTGSAQFARPSAGSWVSYGLGTVNQNLPSFVSLCPGLPVVGPQLWSNSFLPGEYQATAIDTSDMTIEKLIANIKHPSLSRSEQRKQLDSTIELLRAELDAAKDKLRAKKESIWTMSPRGSTQN